jgi:hypothetical protein
LAYRHVRRRLLFAIAPLAYAANLPLIFPPVPSMGASLCLLRYGMLFGFNSAGILDSVGLAEEYMAHHAEEILELFDWTGLEVEFHRIVLERFRGLLTDTLSPATAGMAVWLS